MGLAGELLITLGLVMLLFVVYEVYVTDWMSQTEQRETDAELDDRWSRDRRLPAVLNDGKAFARIRVPAFGDDYKFTIQEGVDADTLAIGPGRYKASGLPGEPGNFGVAGHRTGRGAPFSDLDQLNSCDAIVIETGTTYFIYRVLPMEDEVVGWPSRRGREPQCSDVAPLKETHDAYGATTGRRIVTPDRGDAVWPVPYRPKNILPAEVQVPLLTLTTCHPKWSSRLRLIIHAILTDQYTKNPGLSYTDVMQELGAG